MSIRMPPGYRSSTAYCFDKDQADAIIRVTTWYRKDNEDAVIRFSPGQHDVIRPSIARPFHWNSTASLGPLEQLPLELLQDILRRLDMLSLFKVRQSSISARQAVDSMKQYQLVATYGLNLFCALLRTGSAARVSLSEFHEALCTKACAFCGYFGDFISLLTWDRCCFRCIRFAPETQVQSLTAAKTELGPKKAEFLRFKSIKTLPGMYSLESITQNSRITIVSACQAISVMKHPPRSPPEWDQAYESLRNMKLRCMGAIALLHYDRATGLTQRGISCAGCQLAIEKHIIGNGGEDWAWEVRDRAYSRDEFLEHFQWCEQAQLLWESSDKGRKEPVELPEMVRRGGDILSAESRL